MGTLAATKAFERDAGRCQCAESAALRKAIWEAIVVIEETRSSFKSKKLEALRRKLTEVLINT